MSCGKIHRLSIHPDVDGAKRNHVERGGEDDYLGMQLVRSLSMFHLHGRHKLLKKLGSFILLRVLDLENCAGVTNKHVRYACNLYLLMFLSLRGTNITKVPQ
jgi:disease resistance protein RPM1